MFGKLVKFWFLHLLVFVIDCDGDSDGLDMIYTAISPNSLSPNSYFNVSLALETDREKTTLNGLPLAFHLNMNCTNLIFKGGVPLIYPGQSALDSIFINKDVVPGKYCNLTVSRETLSGHKTQESILIHVNQRQSSILIQTDKPIYKPGEIVNYRIVLLNRQLRPIGNGKNINVTISDPQNNIIKHSRNVPLQIGLHSSKFALSEEPNLGDWKIEVNYGAENSVKFFTVDQYVLPKFKVQVKVPSFLTFNSSQLIAQVKATYTYGKPVAGNCTIGLRISSRRSSNLLERSIPLTTDGVGLIEFDVLKDLDITTASETEFQFDASVRESVTGRIENSTTRVKMYRYPYKIEEINRQETTKPGFPVIYNFKVSYQDNMPIKDERQDALQITHGYSYEDTGYFNSSLPSNGTVTLSVLQPANEFISPLKVRVTYKELTREFYPPRSVLSPSKTYVQLFLETKTPTLGEPVQVFLKANKPFTSINSLVLSRGEILNSQKFSDLPELTTDYKLTFVVPKSGPQATVVVYVVFPATNEILSDSLKINFGPVPLDNFLNISLSEDNAVEPGQDVILTLTSKADSTIALKAIDQSVLLLKNENDIDEERIQYEWKRLGEDNERRRITGGATSFQVFEKAGLSIMTNGNLRRKNFDPSVGNQIYGYGWGSYSTSGANKKKTKNKKKGTVSPSLPSEIRVRQDFPETWIWEEVSAQGGITSLKKKVPDTLTSWVISGYSLNSEYGIGVTTSPQILQTFRPFFLTLNLPYSVVKGETFPLKVLIHNYLDRNVSAAITLENNDKDFDFVDESDRRRNSKNVKVDLLADDVGSVTFIIIPKKIGIIQLNVKGLTSMAGDALSQPLIVKPPGHKEIRNQGIFLDLRSAQPRDIDILERPFESIHTREYIKQHIMTEFPADRVPEADSVKITVIGDLLGPTVTNLDQLIQLPTGCGEQNMLKFVPDILILDYLQILDTLTPEIKSKAIGYLESGYQRQLTYMHGDGSFSAFGKSDSSGSTWLTAFVIKSFAGAAKYITVDKSVILQGLDFIIHQQKDNGEFIEVGRVITSDIQGGLHGNGLALTSYIVTSFIEVSKVYPEINPIVAGPIQNGLEYMAMTYTEATKDLYALNLAAYAFHLANHGKKDEIFHLVEQGATISGEFKFWEKMEAEVKEHQSWFTKIKPASVEMTSYALMTYLLRDRETSSIPVAKWLLQQRNPEGGFISTQDTVVGLTALAKFALVISWPNPELKIEALYGGETQDIFVNKENAFVVQEFFLPQTTRGVRFEAEGKGVALAQLSWSYYVENPIISTFDLRVKVLDDENNGTMLLYICNRFMSPERSNMAVMEVQLPSGYYFDAASGSEIMEIDNVRRHDFEEADTKLIIYFDYFSNVTQCLTLRANRVFQVANPANASVFVYDYYDNTRRGITFYEPPQMNVCDVCKNEVSCQVENCVFLEGVFSAIATQTV